MLYRVFPHVEGRSPLEEGGALFVPRERQGVGRHDNPDRYVALYASRSPDSAVAERIQWLRGQSVTDRDFERPDGARYALVTLQDGRLGDVIDLDDPRELVRRRLRPSGVATRRRPVTRPMALAIFEEGGPGFAWWSTLESSWSNVTLFAERAGPRLEIEAGPEPLTIEHPAVVAAADALGIRRESRSRR